MTLLLRGKTHPSLLLEFCVMSRLGTQWNMRDMAEKKSVPCIKGQSCVGFKCARDQCLMFKQGLS